MIGLDTNVLVRLLTRDDPAAYDRAARFVEGVRDRGEALFVPDVVMAELVWVLERAYGRSRTDVSRVVRAMSESGGFVFESPTRLLTALSRFEAGRGGFTDYLLAARAWEAGCAEVATFDEALLREDGFVAP